MMGVVCIYLFAGVNFTGIYLLAELELVHLNTTRTHRVKINILLPYILYYTTHCIYILRNSTLYNTIYVYVMHMLYK